MNDTTPTLSTRWWRTQIEAHLETCEPARSRWVQEHPHRDQILTSLTIDAVDLWLQATAVRHQPNSPVSVWTSTPASELAATVAAMVIEAPGVWADLDDQFPRTPPAVSAPWMVSTIPVGDPTSPRSHPGR